VSATPAVKIGAETLLYMRAAENLRQERAAMCQRAAQAGFDAGEGTAWWRELAPLSNKERALVRRTVAEAFAKQAASVGR
jgi:hypothetical protein